MTFDSKQIERDISIPKQREKHIDSQSIVTNNKQIGSVSKSMQLLSVFAFNFESTKSANRQFYPLDPM